MCKRLFIVLGLLLFVNIVNGDCEGGISIVDIPVLYSGDTFNVVSTTTISSELGVRNWDLVLRDPLGYTVSERYTRVGNSTYAVTGVVEVDDSFLEGTYTFESFVRVYNMDNLSEVVCSEYQFKTFTVHSNRTTYNQVGLDMDLSPEYRASSQSVIENLSIGGMFFPVNISFRGLPLGVSLSVSPVNLTTNATVELSGNEPVYGFGEMEAAKQVIKNQSEVISNLTGYILPLLENLSNCTVNQDMLESCEVTRGQFKTSYEEMIQKFQNCTGNLNEKEAALGNNWLVGVGGAFVGIVVGGFLVAGVATRNRRRHKESMDWGQSGYRSPDDVEFENE